MSEHIPHLETECRKISCMYVDVCCSDIDLIKYNYGAWSMKPLYLENTCEVWKKKYIWKLYKRIDE